MLIDKDLDEKQSKFNEPVKLDEPQKPKRFAFRSSGLHGLLQAHLGEQLANEIEKLGDDDQQALLHEMVGAS